jgi:hypothetical protein
MLGEHKTHERFW